MLHMVIFPKCQTVWLYKLEAMCYSWIQATLRQTVCMSSPRHILHTTFISLTRRGGCRFRGFQQDATGSFLRPVSALGCSGCFFFFLLTCKLCVLLHFQRVSSPAAGLAGFPVRRLANFTVPALAGSGGGSSPWWTGQLDAASPGAVNNHKKRFPD